MAYRILITNDDGIFAEGLRALEEALSPLGEVTVVAPEREMSGTSQGLTLHTPMRIRCVDQRHYAIAGTPADAVIVSLHHLLERPPDLVASGINPGGNLGENVVYSGTVAAAMEAALHGVPGLAVSLATRQPKNYTPAATFAAELAAKILSEGLPPGVMLNVNVPRGEVKGSRLTRQSQKICQNVIHEQHDPRGKSYFWHDEKVDLGAVEPDSDFAAIVDHEISITPMHVDRTDYPSFNHLSAWMPDLRARQAK